MKSRTKEAATKKAARMGELDDRVMGNLQPGAGETTQLRRASTALPEELALLPTPTHGSQSSVTATHGM